MSTELIAHAIFSFVAGLSIAVTGFGCDATRELFAVLSQGPNAFPASSAINMGLSAGLVTAVQAILQRRLINGGLLLSVLPLTFIGVVLSLNVFSASVRAAFVPVLGACLLGLSMAKLWMELSDCRHKQSVREAEDGERHGASSWKWIGVLATASLVAGLLADRCPPPGPAFMVVLLAGGRGASLVGGGEWRATASLVTCSASLLRVGLLLLENGASVGPMSEMTALLAGGLAGLGVGNLSLRFIYPVKGGADGEQRRTPPPATFRRLVLALALASSIAMATGGPPAALATVARPITLAALLLVCVVAVCGGLWGCTKGAEERGARGAYGTVASDDHDVEVELKPFTAGPDGRGDDDDYLDEEDGYLADEGETEISSRRVTEQGRGGGRRGLLPDSHTGGPGKGKEELGLGGGAAAGKEEKKKRMLNAPPAHSLFPAGHTMEL